MVPYHAGPEGKMNNFLSICNKAQKSKLEKKTLSVLIFECEKESRRQLANELIRSLELTTSFLDLSDLSDCLSNMERGIWERGRGNL